MDHSTSGSLARDELQPPEPVQGEEILDQSQHRGIELPKMAESTVISPSDAPQVLFGPTPPQPPQPDLITYPEGGIRAYSVVLGSFSAMVASFGLMNSVGTFQAYLSTHQLANHSPGTVGWIMSLYLFLSFFCGVQIGPVFDSKGPRWLVLGGSVCLVAGMMGVAESKKYWHFLLSFSLLCGLGTSLIFTPAIGSIAHFFNRSRGSATGIAATGGSVGGIIFPLMLQQLFPRLGFPWAARILAFIFLFLLILANLLIRVRLAPKPSHTIWPDWTIFKDLTFTLTTAGVFFIEWGLFVPLSYISTYALHNDVSPNRSYQLLAIINAGSFFGRWGPGYVADHIGRFNTMIAMVIMCLVCVLGIWMTAGGSIVRLCVFSVGFGFASGSNISLTPSCIGQLCHTDAFGRWYATCYTVVSFGCLTGVPIAGAILNGGGGGGTDAGGGGGGGGGGDDGYKGLVLFTGGCYAAGLGCFLLARGRRVGWGVRGVF